jgi:ATP phosphoribosyltransferase
LNKTNIKEINSFIEAHNKLIESLNGEIKDQEELNDKLLNSLDELEKEKKKYMSLFMNIPNPVIKIKVLFDDSDGGRKTFVDAIVVDVNSVFVDSFNIKNNIVNKNLSELMTPVNNENSAGIKILFNLFLMVSEVLISRY